jgi:nucleotide-binding universal stress UspA family protein
MKLLACVNLRDDEVEHVVDGAGEWASLLQTTVDVLYVDEATPVPMWVTDPLSAQLLTARWDEVRKEEDRRLTGLLERLPVARRGAALRVEGRPAEEIVARSVRYAAVVVAGRQHTALSRALLGSIATRVARLCPVPVLVLPGGPPPEPDSEYERIELTSHAPNPGARPRRIHVLFGVDLRAEDAGTGLAQAAEWAVRVGAELDVVHVDDSHLHVPYILDPDIRSRFEQEWEALRRRDLATLTGLLERVADTHRGAPRVEEGEAANSLSLLAREYDLLILATHGRTGMARFVLGSVAEKVIQACEVPVLLLRATAEK